MRPFDSRERYQKYIQPPLNPHTHVERSRTGLHSWHAGACADGGVGSRGTRRRSRRRLRRACARLSGRGGGDNPGYIGVGWAEGGGNTERRGRNEAGTRKGDEAEVEFNLSGSKLMSKFKIILYSPVCTSTTSQRVIWLANSGVGGSNDRGHRGRALQRGNCVLWLGTLRGYVLLVVSASSELAARL